MRPITVLRAVALLLAFSAGAGPVSAQSARRPMHVWIQIDGVVEELDGDWLMFQLDDGRRLAVDVSPMGALERMELTPAVRTALIGYPDLRRARFVAWFSRPTAPTAIAPSALLGIEVPRPAARTTATPPAWRIVHGRVDRLDGTTLMVRSDGGAKVLVDVADVDTDVLRTVSHGEPVTVIGLPGAGTDHVQGRYLHRDTAELATSAPVRR